MLSKQEELPAVKIPFLVRIVPYRLFVSNGRLASNVQMNRWQEGTWGEEKKGKKSNCFGRYLGTEVEVKMCTGYHWE